MEFAASDSSNVNPVALLLLVVTAIATVRCDRQVAVKSLLTIAAFLPLGQQFVIAGLHFQFFRILVIVGFIRVVSRGEAAGTVLTVLDKLFICWAIAGLLCSAIRDPDKIMGDRCMGAAFNAFGTYFLLRCLIKEPSEIVAHLRFFCIAALIIALAMAWEVTTHRNLLSIFGGVPETVLEREGRFRCQGPFRHPILAGTFAATLFPLFVGLWLSNVSNRKIAVVGLVSSLFSTAVAASSGALLTCVTAAIGFALWPLRYEMRWIRRGMVAFVIAVTIIMRPPPWYLIAKMSDLLGGTGWHRSYLIDQAVKYFGEWWLIGSSVTAHWAPAGQVLPIDPQNMDITNNYITQGLQGGVLCLGLFIGIIVCCFSTVGRSVRQGGQTGLTPKLSWALGVSLAGHCTAFISITYFDQIQVFWIWLLAVIASIAQQELVSAVQVTPEAEEHRSDTFAAI